MNSVDLRKKIDSIASLSEHELREIMSEIKKHVDFVVGEDESFGQYETADTEEKKINRNELRAEQRNRAGVYG